MKAAGKAISTKNMNAKEWLGASRSSETKQALQVKWAMRQVQAGEVKYARIRQSVVNGITAKIRKGRIAGELGTELSE